jgi:hypothetical protein
MQHIKKFLYFRQNINNAIKPSITILKKPYTCIFQNSQEAWNNSNLAPETQHFELKLTSETSLPITLKKIQARTHQKQQSSETETYNRSRDPPPILFLIMKQMPCSFHTAVKNTY